MPRLIADNCPTEIPEQPKSQTHLLIHGARKPCSNASRGVRAASPFRVSLVPRVSHPKDVYHSVVQGMTTAEVVIEATLVGPSLARKCLGHSI